MLDNRIYTFIKLCDLMNYRATAEALNMTQPAVTQHIHFLESEYNCKLFKYDKKKLYKTKDADILEQYARSAIYNDMVLQNKLKGSEKIKIKIGATKSIGNYMIRDKIIKLIDNNDIEVSFYIDNTEILLDMLNHSKINFALIEGFFDKNIYEYKLYRVEKFVGICSKNHAFANKKIPLKSIFEENLIVREEGSGTRKIFEQILLEYNYTLDNFEKISCISDFEIIKQIVKENKGISFVYETVAENDEELSFFTIENKVVKRELNYVYLKNASAENFISIFEK